MTTEQKIVAAFAALADDLSEQGLRAHGTGKMEVSEALYGVASGIRRVMIDELGQDGGGDPEKRPHQDAVRQLLSRVGLR